MSALKAEVAKVLASHPDWTFTRCWQELRRKRPELFVESSRRVDVSKPPAAATPARQPLRVVHADESDPDVLLIQGAYCGLTTRLDELE